MGACHSKGSRTYSTKGTSKAGKIGNDKSMVDNVNGWDYPGIKDRVDKLEDALSKARSTSKINSIARAARASDELIGQEIERLHNGTADIKGNENALLTQRRRIRNIIRRAKF